MSDHVYKLIEVVGSSKLGSDDAIRNAIETAAKYENESVENANRPFASEKTLPADWSTQRMPSSLRRTRRSRRS